MSEIIGLHTHRSDPVFLAWIRSKGWDPAVLSDLQLRSVHIGFEAEASNGPLDLTGAKLLLHGVPGGLKAFRERSRR